MRPDDWVDVTHALTKDYGVTFAVLNMANAFGPGGGYADGSVAQEEHMFRRTDCHFSLACADLSVGATRPAAYTVPMYAPQQTALLEATRGRVYLDVARPRVCVRGGKLTSNSQRGYHRQIDKNGGKYSYSN